MVPVIEILVFSGLLRAIASAAGPIFYALGAPRIDTRWQSVRLIVLVVLIYPFTFYWGIIGTSAVVLLSTLALSIGVMWECKRLIEFQFHALRRILLFPAVNMLSMIGIVTFLSGFINDEGLLGLFVLASTGILAYISVAYVFDRLFDYGLYELGKELINHLTGRSA
jgi:lipopolysaccharide exporter